MSANLDEPFSVILDDDTIADGVIRQIDAGPQWAKHRVTIELDDGDDTSGHGFGEPNTVAVKVRFENDVEAHSLSLHFPTAAGAEDFKKRVIAAGFVAAALVAGVTAAQLTATPTAQATPVAAPAPIVQPLVNPNIPAEDLAPAINPVVPLIEPKVNPNIPAEDLVPSTDTTQPASQPLPERPITNDRGK